MKLADKHVKISIGLTILVRKLKGRDLKADLTGVVGISIVLSILRCAFIPVS